MIETESIIMDASDNKSEDVMIKTEDGDTTEMPSKKSKGMMESLLSDDEDDIGIIASYKRTPTDMAKDEVRS